MEKLEIYHPYKFYPSRTLIIYSAVALLLFLSFILQELGFDHNTAIYDSVVYLALFCFICGMVIKLFSLGKYKPLYGKLVGGITFEKESVGIHGATISIDKITKLEFEGSDWIGLYEHNRFSFENGLSNGTKNWLIIHLVDSSQRRIRFQKYEACQLVRFKEVLLDYYVKGKISYLQIVDNLCLETPEEWNTLKSMKNRTTVNNI
ncbi:hypothetical protein [Pontibacter litorisediminis]|uniref:hypothetical protein n=1 Tax=Pontibacter litorisediminis TaxID=1846260 RepID=UPI0023EACD11|nr:hypothetical protein [Pontibacter litorisediminis]